MILNHPAVNSANQVKGGFVLDDTLLIEKEKIIVDITRVDPEGKKTLIATLESASMPAPAKDMLYRAHGRIVIEQIKDPAVTATEAVANMAKIAADKAASDASRLKG
jgi:hypothetical protein